MNQLTRASMRWSRLIGGRRPSSAAAVAPKPFSTEASGPSLGSPDDQFLQTPSTGVVYGRLSDISKHTTKSDIINLLDDSNLSPEKLRVEYNRAYFPLSMLVQFPSASSYDSALRSIGRKGRLYNIRRADKAEWDVSQLHDGKAIVLHGIPRNAAIDDIERFLCGCHSSSIQISVRPTNEGPIRMALVRFPSQALAMHAYITKNRGFCLNNQITFCSFVQVVVSAKVFRSVKLVGDLVKESNVLPVDKFLILDNMENSRTKNQRRRSWTPSSMSRTLWSSTESPTKDLRSNSDDKKGVNVQVVVRCRPLSEDEARAGTSLMISCDGTKQQVIATQSTANKQTDRVFVFDKVFGPTSQQKELYDDVVAPVISEVLEGYSCTIFAYGQTGTGKTYTMEGEGRKQKNGEFHKDAGVIPRAVQQIFDVLESEKTDYSIKATFLELYNEEITDLLASDESKRPLVLMEDGKGAVFVRGLEEEIVCSVDEISAILDKGSSRKHMAETLVNKQSNRSHSIFTITIQIKDPNSSDGSELIRCGRLNLVDLAGSENILRSGAREVRAREAGEINKSLLTLGRVIYALADNSTHVPYRDSKLTRLLRDSLGGKTKTCIIATVSPSILSQEETLSTLDYAFRAKSIKNRPEVNQKLLKSTLIKDLYTQIDSLKQELHVTRQGNGSYAAESERHSADAMRKQLMELQELYIYQQQLRVDLEDKLKSTERELTTTRQSLFNLEDQYQQAKDMCKDKETLVFNLISSGKELGKRALELRSDLEGAASDVSTLFAKIEHKNYIEDRNRQNIQNFYSQLVQQLQESEYAVSNSATLQEQNWKAIQDNTQSFLSSKDKAIDELLKQIEHLKVLYASGVKNLDGPAEELYQNSQSAISRLNSELSAHYTWIMDLVTKNASDADAINNGLKSNINNLGLKVEAFIKQQEENHARTYQTTKSISNSLVNFFKTLRIYISKLTLIEEDSLAVTNQKLHSFTTKFEEFSLAEERLLLEQMAELLANSNSRKKKMIQAAVDDVLDSASNRSEKLNQEISDMHGLSGDAEKKWHDFIDRTESNYVEDSAAVEAAKCTLEEGLQFCINKLTDVSQQQRVSEESLLDEIKKDFDSRESLIKNETEVNGRIHARFSSTATSLVQERDDAMKKLTLSAENSLRLDHEASEKANLLSARCLVFTKATSTSHTEQVAEISSIARKSLVDDYLVDSCSSSLSPRKRNLVLPTTEQIESLIASTLGDSLHSPKPDAVAS